MYYYQRANYPTANSRDNRSAERHDGRPPTGRVARSDRLPSNFDSLPPRFKKKYEEERLMGERVSQAPNDHSSHSNVDWDGGSVTFSSASRLPHSQSFPSTRSKIQKGTRAILGSNKTTQYHQEHEDSDASVPRPRSQDSVDRERKISFTDSRSSTPSSSLEFQPYLPAGKH